MSTFMSCLGYLNPKLNLKTKKQQQTLPLLKIKRRLLVVVFDIFYFEYFLPSV